MDPRADAAFVLRVLGGVDLATGSGVPVEAVLRHPKRLAVLAYLVCARPRGFHRRDRIAALFWPELAPERARAALRTTLTRLRADLGEASIVTRGSDDVRITEGLVRCDVVELERLLGDAEPMAARALYRGPFFEGLHVEGAGDELESWISSERRRVPQQLAAALSTRATRATTEGSVGEAVALLRAALEVSPVDERTARALISAQVASGDRGSAFATFDALADRLRREYDVAPSTETVALIAPLRAERPAPVTVDGPPERGEPSPRRRSSPKKTLDSAGAVGPAAATIVSRRRWRGLPMLAALSLGVSAVLWAGTQLVSDASASSTLRWRLAPTEDGRREARAHAAVLLDSTRGSLVVVGGLVRAEPAVFAADFLRARGAAGDRRSAWRTDSAIGAGATSRWITASALDLAHDRAIVFGGASGTTLPCHNDVWLLRDVSGLGGRSRWEAVRTRGTPPSPRADAQVFLDAERKALVLYGGHDCVSVYHRDAWILRFDDSTLTSGTWVARPLAAGADEPSPRIHSMVEYDARAGRLFVVHGEAANGPIGELWVLDGLHREGPPSWRTLDCANAPQARAHAPSVWDDDAQAMVIIGGVLGRDEMSNEIWRLAGLDGAASSCYWQRLRVEGPAPTERYAAVAHFDPRARRVILYGGYHRGAPLIDVWTLSDPFPR